jgi:lipoprotein-anchoring transpeptidase ErfK/SrfK
MSKRVVGLLLGAGVVIMAVAAPFLYGNKKTQPDNAASQAIDNSVKAPAHALFNKAQALIAGGNKTAGRAMLKEFIEKHPDSALIADAQKKLWDVNVAILFSGELDAYSTRYTVRPGDTLFGIAKKFSTTVDLLMQANNLKTDVIMAGTKIKVPAVTFSVVVDKSQNTLALKAGEEVFKVYRVATGKDNGTPTGNFSIVEKIVNPTWYKDGQEILPQDPRNILGTRWMELSLKGYGIHGTREPQSIGTQSTAGCVRMYNHDVEELYKIIPKGTHVTIID